MFIHSQRSGESSEPEKKLVWLYIPDYNKNGMLSSIKHVSKSDRDIATMKFKPGGEGEFFWEEVKNCSGFVVSDKDCHLRIDEMQLVSYQPEQCKSGEYPNCSELVAYARYNIK